jgi:hypothetical protein
MAGLLTLWTLAGLAISGETRCPSAAAVRAELGQLRQGRAPDASDGARISLARRGGRLRVVLLGRDGSELMARELPAGGRCRALARSTALLIEVWTGQGRTVVALQDGGVALQDGAAARQDGAAARQSDAVSVTRPAPAEVRPEGEADEALTAAGTARVARLWNLEVAAGALGSVAGGFAGGAALDVTLRRPAALGLKAGLAATGERAVRLGHSAVAWMRPGAMLGFAYRVAAGGFRFDLHGDVVLAAVVARAGAGFVAPRSAVNFDVGIGAGVRLLRPLRFSPGGMELAPFVELRAVEWVRGAQVMSLDGSGTERFPAIEVLVALGFSLGSR